MTQLIVGPVLIVVAHPDDEVLGAGRREVYVKVRSTRAPQPAWLLRGGGGVVVELIDGEDGVAPGQACVFYDAPDGPARVLGGGFIKSTLAMTKGTGAVLPEAAPATPAS